ncbi:hypothetical protein ACMD2_02673 [Ananas comosus]|uniref:Uncharacterized protein n=1 Tax=Ananas comosus TaxID=4615 RepID=A0A199VMI5_ANACO|nr:hypothetical protein ACMD2_02673 [Ananas comosus]
MYPSTPPALGVKKIRTGIPISSAGYTANPIAPSATTHVTGSPAALCREMSSLSGGPHVRRVDAQSWGTSCVPSRSDWGRASGMVSNRNPSTPRTAPGPRDRTSRAWLNSVLTKVMRKLPRAWRSFASLSIGVTWPCAGNGKNTACGAAAAAAAAASPLLSIGPARAAHVLRPVPVGPGQAVQDGLEPEPEDTRSKARDDADLSHNGEARFIECDYYPLNLPTQPDTDPNSNRNLARPANRVPQRRDQILPPVHPDHVVAPPADRVNPELPGVPGVGPTAVRPGARRPDLDGGPTVALVVPAAVRDREVGHHPVHPHVPVGRPQRRHVAGPRPVVVRHVERPRAPPRALRRGVPHPHVRRRAGVGVGVGPARARAEAVDRDVGRGEHHRRSPAHHAEPRRELRHLRSVQKLAERVARVGDLVGKYDLRRPLTGLPDVVVYCLPPLGHGGGERGAAVATVGS